jgi:hypothetical protein
MEWRLMYRSMSELFVIVRHQSGEVVCYTDLHLGGING